MIMKSYQNKIEEATKIIGKTWPLYSFVTSNPLSGYENSPFLTSVQNAANARNAKAFPDSETYKFALKHGKINQDVLEKRLKDHHYNEDPAFYIKQLESLEKVEVQNINNELDRIMVKWLMVFMDEGLAEWEMPNKKKGFYRAWRKLAAYDTETNIDSETTIPKTAVAALTEVLNEIPEADHQKVFEYHLAALPGWVGYIKHREENQTDWQKKFPITVEHYLAVRLYIAKSSGISIVPKVEKLQIQNSLVTLQYIFLQAWEKSWQNNLLQNLQLTTSIQRTTKLVPEAQFVFCIDTRSELIRRNVEKAGNYETFGYAGFFGLAMDYVNPENGLVRKSCPPIVGSAYKVTESAQQGKNEEFARFQHQVETKHFSDYFLKRMKNMLPSAFGYVEGAGLFYGGKLLGRTLFPAALYKSKKNSEIQFENNCEPKIHPNTNEKSALSGISLAEKVGIVKSAFDLMGWQVFAPVVLFVGHGSHTANNAFGSSLDCGACAASPGRHNARMLAQLANLPEVREKLVSKYNLKLSNETLFVGAEHNTTTDEISIFDSDAPNSHLALLAEIRKNLKVVQQTATSERLPLSKDSITNANEKSNNWSEPRPEWGLAKNAGFIIGPRALTVNSNLDGNCFLHSYNWKLDPDGGALQGIMQGPMVVTQWINNHYYFSTIDNDNYGGGNKITQNITGKFGVVQGNGGDLKMGLPLQSVNETDAKNYHEPLRLSVIIQAPKDRVQDILERNENLKYLLDNEWIYLLVMDPTLENAVYKYEKNLEWTIASESKMEVESL